jgi:ketol-acid reductoisomerase
VREEYKRGFGVPTLIAVHTENDPNGEGMELAKAYAVGTGGHRAGVLESSFIAEVKSDLMGEQTILCGMLQTGSILCFDKMVEKGIDSSYASRLIQYGWETITEGLKHGGITNMMDRLGNPAKLRAFYLAEELKTIMRSLYEKHQDDIMTGTFSRTMMEDWANDDKNLLTWRAATAETAFEKSENSTQESPSRNSTTTASSWSPWSRPALNSPLRPWSPQASSRSPAYYESLHETPLIANTIARKKLYEMNVVISDTAEYGCYLFDHACRPLLADFMADIETDVIGRGMGSDCTVDNQELIRVNDAIRCASGGGRGQDPARPHDGYEEHPLKNASPLEAREHWLCSCACSCKAVIDKILLPPTT